MKKDITGVSIQFSRLNVQRFQPDETENDDENVSPDDSVSDETSSDDSSSDESMDEEGNKIYKEADLDIARFIIKMRLAFNAQHEVDFTAVDYLMILFKKFKVLCQDQAYRGRFC